MEQLKPPIKFEDFTKVDMRAGTVLSAEEVEGSDKLIKLDVDFGEIGKKQVLSGIREWYEPKDLVNKQFIFVLNIEPRKMMGLESQGMILAADSEEGVVVLIPKENVTNGTIIR